LLNAVAIPTHLHVVNCGAAALGVLRHEAEYAQAPRPDVIFLDLDLPGIDELQLLDELQHDPALRAVPVVLCSATDCEKDHLVAAGLVAAYLTHALEREQFMKLLEKLLRRT